MHNSMRFRICVTTPNYPSPNFPECGVFVHQCAQDWRNENCAVQVIHPCSISTLIKRIQNSPTTTKHVIDSEDVMRPLFLALSNKKLGPINTHDFSRAAFQAACHRAQRKQTLPSVFYGKFLMSGGRAAVRLGARYNRPAFIDLGESSLIESLSVKERGLAEQILKEATGVVCVSPRLANEGQLMGVPSSNILLKPNQVDINTFRPIPRQNARAKLGLPQNAFITSFTGHFIERKGPLRLLEALENIKQGNVKGVFLGRGPQQPKSDKVLFAGPVEHNDLPLWLSASDIFVLPTLSEGNCNAINEAQAMGLPVVTSDIPDTEHQVPNTSGIRVDPNNVHQLTQAIQDLFLDPELRATLASSALELSQLRNKNNRSLDILKWLKNKSHYC